MGQKELIAQKKTCLTWVREPVYCSCSNGMDSNLRRSWYETLERHWALLGVLFRMTRIKLNSDWPRAGYPPPLNQRWPQLDHPTKRSVIWDARVSMRSDTLYMSIQRWMSLCWAFGYRHLCDSFSLWSFLHQSPLLIRHLHYLGSLSTKKTKR